LLFLIGFSTDTAAFHLTTDYFFDSLFFVTFKL